MIWETEKNNEKSMQQGNGAAAVKVLELYNALNGTNYGNGTKVEMQTLERNGWEVRVVEIRI